MRMLINVCVYIKKKDNKTDVTNETTDMFFNKNQDWKEEENYTGKKKKKRRRKPLFRVTSLEEKKHKRTYFPTDKRQDYCWNSNLTQGKGF